MEITKEEYEWAKAIEDTCGGDSGSILEKLIKEYEAKEPKDELKEAVINALDVYEEAMAEEIYESLLYARLLHLPEEKPPLTKEPDITEHPLWRRFLVAYDNWGVDTTEYGLRKLFKSLLEFMVCKSCGGVGWSSGESSKCGICGKQEVKSE